MEMFEYMMEGEIYYNLQPTVYFYTVQKYKNTTTKNMTIIWKKGFVMMVIKFIATGRTRTHGLQVCALTYELL